MEPEEEHGTPYKVFKETLSSHFYDNPIMFKELADANPKLIRQLDFTVRPEVLLNELHEKQVAELEATLAAEKSLMNTISYYKEKLQDVQEKIKQLKYSAGSSPLSDSEFLGKVKGTVHVFKMFSNAPLKNAFLLMHPAAKEKLASLCSFPILSKHDSITHYDGVKIMTSRDVDIDDVRVVIETR